MPSVGKCLWPSHDWFLVLHLIGWIGGRSFFKPITERSKTKPKQFCDYFRCSNIENRSIRTLSTCKIHLWMNFFCFLSICFSSEMARFFILMISLTVVHSGIKSQNLSLKKPDKTNSLPERYCRRDRFSSWYPWNKLVIALNNVHDFTTITCILNYMYIFTFQF